MTLISIVMNYQKSPKTPEFDVLYLPVRNLSRAAYTITDGSSGSSSLVRFIRILYNTNAYMWKNVIFVKAREFAINTEKKTCKSTCTYTNFSNTTGLWQKLSQTFHKKTFLSYVHVFYQAFRSLWTYNFSLQMVKMVIIVATLYAVSQLPRNVIFMCGIIQPNLWAIRGSQMMWIACHLVAVSGTCYNPVIYCWMSKNFRYGFARVLRPCLPCCLRNRDRWSGNDYLAIRSQMTYYRKDDRQQMSTFSADMRTCNSKTTNHSALWEDRSLRFLEFPQFAFLRFAFTDS